MVGHLPFVEAFPLLFLAGWLFFRSASTKPHLSEVVSYCIGGAIGIFFLVFIAARARAGDKRK